MATTGAGTPYVESSDLVANYPAVSESLAERVDLVGVLPFADSTARGTALPSPTDGQYSYLQDTNATEYWNGSAWVAAGVAPGLVHINTTTFSAVSSVSINDCFSATYDNYFMMIECSSSTAVTLNARLRVAGADASGANYNFQLFTADSTSITAARTTSATSVAIGLVNNGATERNTAQTHLYSPFLAQQTCFVSQGLQQSSSPLQRNYYGSHQVTTSYTGVTVFPGSGTITGTIRIYGYKNS